jgi:Protein of unknown function DUF88.
MTGFDLALDKEKEPLRLAVLIDADNASASKIDFVLTEISKFGNATVKRIYGDFTLSSSSQWKKVLSQHAIKPVQQFAYTTGKNATDCTLIIDAMDLLYTRRFDGFCLVSSDSDFTSIALRIREEGLFVFGFGRQTTPSAFCNACSQFIYIDNNHDAESIAILNEKDKMHSVVELDIKNTDKIENKEPFDNKKIKLVSISKKTLLKAFDFSKKENGWAELGVFGKNIRTLIPDFDLSRYGFSKMNELIKSRPDVFVFDSFITKSSSSPQAHIKLVSKK